MARALATHAVQFAADQRGAVLDGLRARRDRLRAGGCSYWLFEDPGVPGVFIEFLEARDGEILRRARQGAGLPRSDSPILSEVEF